VKRILPIAVTAMIAGCSLDFPVAITYGDSITEAELESFFRKHKVENHYVVALKKRSIVDVYLVTVHGYPNNLSVCEDLIAPYNKDASRSTIPGDYYCEELR